MTANRHRTTNGLKCGFEPICRVLQMSPATIRSHLARPTCARRIDEETLSARINVLHAENYSVYGARKVSAALAEKAATSPRTTSLV